MRSTILNNQRKSFVMATLLFGLLLLILFFIRFWPPSNLQELMGGGGGGGVSLNFGDSDLGSGTNYESEVLEINNQEKPVSIAVNDDESILSQDNSPDESVVIPTKDKTTKPTTPLKEQPKTAVVKPKVSAIANDALSSLMKSANKGGDGDDKAAGNKGNANGSLGSKDYYGTGGTGGGTGGGNGTGNGTGTGSGNGPGSGAGSGGGVGSGAGYALGNRKAISKPAPKYTCNETGTVVVEVAVDRNGKTTSVIAGIKGTTNTAKCLLEQARIAALNTKWDASGDAPEKQVGKIIYNFNLN